MRTLTNLGTAAALSILSACSSSPESENTAPSAAFAQCDAIRQLVASTLWAKMQYKKAFPEKPYLPTDEDKAVIGINIMKAIAAVEDETYCLTQIDPKY